VRQGFEETFFFDDGSALGAASRQTGTQTVPTLNAQAGLGWSPPGSHLRFSVGYQFEQWWNVGRLGDSRGDLYDQGAFFRAEFCY
jgi:hypothetical protein